MKISLKTRLALWWRRVRDRQSVFPDSISIALEGRGVSSVLIILPDSPASFRIAHHFLKSILSRYNRDIQVKFLCRQAFKDFFNSEARELIITYSNNDLDQWGLPTLKFANQLFLSPVDAVVDLNAEFNPVSAFLVQMSNAPLRLGFNSELADKYYNIVMAHRGSTFLEKEYIKIQKLLGL